MSASQVRTFVAVPLPAAIRAAIQAVARELSPRFPDLKWTSKPENLHLTLRFLGQLDEAVMGRFADALAAALGPRPGFEIDLRGLGAFPSPRDARVVWVGVEDPSRRLADVAGLVGSVADQFGFGLAARSDNDNGGDHDPGRHDQGRVDGARAGHDDGLPARPFRAHVTIGRTARRAPGLDVTAALAAWSGRALGRVSVREVHVYESITGGDASTYVLRGKATLQPS